MSTERVREALEQNFREFQEEPRNAYGANSPATAVWRGGVQIEISGPNGERAVTDMPGSWGGDGASAQSPGWLFRAGMASCSATVIAMRAAMLGIELTTLEVNVESESDNRGLVGIDGVSTALTGVRLSIKIGAQGVPEAELRELAKWGNARSPVSCTLRERPELALDVTIA